MKKWIALALALIMLLGLCACAETGDPNTGDNSTVGTNTTNTTDPTDNNDNNGGESNEKEEEVTVSLLTQVVINDIYDDEIETTDKMPEYDEDYNLIGIKTYLGGNLNGETTYDKDPNRPLVEQKYNENGEVEWKYVYIYDEDGNMQTKQSYTGDELDYEMTYSYDEYGNLLEERYPDDHENWGNTYENTYENGKLVEVKTYRDGTFSGLVQYDSDGNETLNVSYFDIEEEYRTESTYENGRLVTRVVYWYGEESSRCEYFYTFDEDGNLTKELEISDGDEWVTTYTYNENGDLIGMSRNENGQVSEITWIYETVTVSKEQAESIEKVVSMLSMGDPGA